VVGARPIEEAREKRLALLGLVSEEVGNAELEGKTLDDAGLLFRKMLFQPADPGHVGSDDVCVEERADEPGASGAFPVDAVFQIGDKRVPVLIFKIRIVAPVLEKENIEGGQENEKDDADDVILLEEVEKTFRSHHEKRGKENEHKRGDYDDIENNEDDFKFHPDTPMMKKHRIV
jgi:hypothetical protein